VRRRAARMPSSVRWTARFVALTGVVDLLTVVLPPARDRLGLLTEVVPLTGVQTARAATAAVGLLLIYLSVGLRRRTREAWWVAVALAAVSVVLNMLKGLDLDAAGLSAGLLAILLNGRRDYCAVAGRGSRWRALVALAGFGGAGLAVGVAQIAMRSASLVPGQSRRLWVVQAAEGMAGASGPLRFTHPAVADAVSLTTGSMGLLAAAMALVVLLRPVGRRPGHTRDDVERIGRLLAAYGGQDSLGYFALRPDKSMIWSPTWQPQYLCYSSLNDLPRIGLVALRAEAFLTAPEIVVRLRERVRRPAPATAQPEPQHVLQGKGS